MQTIPSAHDPGNSLQEIRAAASRGWRIHPLRGPDDASLSEKERGKTPLLEKWQNRSTSDFAQLERWAKQFPACNWGAVTGFDSGMFVLDLDGKQGAADQIAFQQQGRLLPATLCVSTGHGKHLYFRWPKGHTVRTSVKKIAPGSDVRGVGAYVVIPPSIHVSGAQYAFADQTAPIAEAPRWLLDLVSVPLNVGVHILTEGKRNDTLFRRACERRRSGATQKDLESFLFAENLRVCRPALDGDEILQIAASAARYPVGGPDFLEAAWHKVLSEEHSTTYLKFLSLSRHLQLARPGHSIALPLERIGGLMGFNWTLIRRYRQRAVSEGHLLEVAKAVCKSVAGHYRVITPCAIESTSQGCTTSTSQGGTTSSTTSC